MSIIGVVCEIALGLTSHVGVDIVVLVYHAGEPPALPIKRREQIALTTRMINQCLASAAASVAMDGAAPESSQDGSLREEPH